MVEHQFTVKQRGVNGIKKARKKPSFYHGWVSKYRE
jgi:hypothetical protein